MTTDRKQMVDWARSIVSTLSGIEDSASANARSGIAEAITSFESEFFCLAVLGKAKRGKSTLINALLGRTDDKVAPTDKLPASSTITRFRWAEQYHAAVAYREGEPQAISLDEIRNYVTEEGNPNNSKGVRSVDVSGPFPRLEKDLVIVDTPGAGSIHDHHDELLHAYIPQADAVIILVTARMPIDQDELDLLREVAAADIKKVFFAINRTDQSDEAAIEAAIRHNSELLSHVGIPVSKIHRISALKAFQGDWDNSGVGGFAREIQEFLDENKGKVVASRFVARVCTALETVVQSLDIQLAALSKSTGQIEAELNALRTRKAAIESERQFAEREFTNTWSLATDDFETDLRSAKKSVKAAIASKIKGAPLTELDGFTKRLPTELNEIIEDQLQPVSRRFEETARSACEKLQTNYPAVRFGESGGITLGGRDNHLALGGAVGGVVIATTGSGLAFAGASAAAAIAAANAAAVAATTTVAAPSLISGLLTMAGAYFPAISYLAPLATGTATVAAPAALTTAPLWVALAGPVGWTLAGVGLLAIPFSWRLSKLRMKDRLEEICQEQVDKVFVELVDERTRKLRSMGKNLAEEVRLRLDRQVSEIEKSLQSGLGEHARDPDRVNRLKTVSASITGLLNQRPI